jgi:hypothetical protein
MKGIGGNGRGSVSGSGNNDQRLPRRHNSKTFKPSPFAAAAVAAAINITYLRGQPLPSSEKGSRTSTEGIFYPHRSHGKENAVLNAANRLYGLVFDPVSSNRAE